jgi:mRNA interferase RelE/StbE
MYEVIFSKKAEKFLDKINPKDQERILLATERLLIRPESYIVRLVGSPLYKFRVGNYRLLMDFEKGRLTILCVEIGHRKNIYK